MIGTFAVDERVSVHVDGHRCWGTVRQVLAGRLLVIELPDGRRIRRHSA